MSLSVLKARRQEQPEQEALDVHAANAEARGEQETAAPVQVAPAQAAPAAPSAEISLDDIKPNAAKISIEPPIAGTPETAPVAAASPETAAPASAEAAQPNADSEIEKLITALGISDEDARLLLEQHRAAQEELKKRSDDLDRAISESAAAQRGNGRGGVLSLLAMLLVRGNSALERQRSAVDKERRQLPLKFRERIYDIKRKQAVENMLAVGAAGDKLAAKVSEFNTAFAATEAGKQFDRNVADYAATNGLGREDVLDLVYGQSSTDPRLVAARKQALAAFGEPAVAASWKAVNDAQDDLGVRIATMRQDIHDLHRNFPDRMDKAKVESSVRELVTGISSRTPQCVAEHPEDVEKRKKLQERLAEMVREIQEAIERIFEAIGQKLGFK